MSVIENFLYLMAMLAIFGSLLCVYFFIAEVARLYIRWRDQRDKYIDVDPQPSCIVKPGAMK